MKYMLLIYADQSNLPEFTPEERLASVQEWSAVMSEMKTAGILLGNDGLAPVEDATSVRFRDGKAIIADGPFAETHEQLGGYIMLECKDLDEALSWAVRLPGAKFGTIEVRPINTYTQARDAAAARNA